MMGFRFQDPLWLLLLIPLALLAWLAARRRRRTAIVFSSVAIPALLPVTLALRIKRLLPWVGVAATALLIVALARPQQGEAEFRIRTEGIAIAMCLDRSGSMEAIDFEIDGEKVNRLAAVKDVFTRFVLGSDDLPGRTNDQIGLIAFGGYADDKCPPTLDHDMLAEIVETVEIPQPIFDEQGRMINQRLLQEELATAIGDAIALGVERLRGVKAKSKALILLSDGEQTVDSIEPLEAAEAAKTYDVKIYTIGIGSTGTAEMPLRDRYGRHVRDRSGRLVTRPTNVRLDEQTLRDVAEATGGRYFNANSTEALEQVYAEIDKLEKTEIEGRLYTEYNELYRYPTFAALGMFLLGVVLTSTRFRSLP